MSDENVYEVTSQVGGLLSGGSSRRYVRGSKAEAERVASESRKEVPGWGEPEVTITLVADEPVDWKRVEGWFSLVEDQSGRFLLRYPRKVGGSRWRWVTVCRFHSFVEAVEKRELKYQELTLAARGDLYGASLARLGWMGGEWLRSDAEEFENRLRVLLGGSVSG